MDWIWIAALAWAAVSLPLALLTGWYLRRSDERDVVTGRYARRFPAAAPGRTVRRLAARTSRRSGRGRTPGLTAGPVPPSSCMYRAPSAPGTRGRRAIGLTAGVPDPAAGQDDPPSPPQDAAPGRTPARASGESRSRSRFYRHL